MEHSVTSRGGFDQHATHPLFLCLHGWGSSEEDMADIMRLIAPYNDFVALRGPLTLAPAREGSPDPATTRGFTMPCLSAMIVTTTRMPPPQQSTDGWPTTFPPTVTWCRLGFRKVGWSPCICCASTRAVPGRRLPVRLQHTRSVPGTAPADSRLADYDIPVFYTYGKNDGVIPKYELFATAAWLEEHTWLKTKSYHGLDHNVSLEEFADLRQWLLDNDITSGVL